MRKLKFWTGDLAAAAPVYVTRKDSDGVTGTWSMSMWMALLVMFLVWLVIVLWSVVGIAVALGLLF